MSEQSENNSQSKFELKTVLETSRMLVESRDTDFIINNLLLILMGRLLITKAAIFLNGSQDGIYTLKKSKGFLNLKQGEKYKILSDQQQVRQSYFSANSSEKSFQKIINHHDSTFFFNLRTSNNHHGFLLLGPKANGQPFNDHELEFAEGLCIISTAALVNSELFTELTNTYRNLDRRIHELNTLFDLSKEFNLLIDREQISRIFKLTLLGQLFIRTFFLIYKSEEAPQILASSGIKRSPESGDVAQLFADTDADTVVIDENFEKKHPWVGKNDISALISISIQNEKVAVIGVGERVNKIPFNESDFNFLRSLANLAVISIQKTYYLEDRIYKERMEEEMVIAKTIQRGLLPDPLPEIEGVDLAARTISSRDVGGDYYDIAKTPDGNTILSIADVTGKGMPAALLMANLQSMLHVLLPVDITLSEATDRINTIIYQNTPPDKFITFFWGKYISKHKILKYVNAGHNPPLLLRKEADCFEELSEGGLLLGAMNTIMPYEETDIQLNPGDILVCYTDGVDETMAEDKEEEFGVPRLKECIKKHRDLSSEQIIDSILKSVNEFSGENFSDDLTLLVLKACE